MAKKFTAFVISPIGEAGTKTRMDADDLLDLIIKPALEIYDFEVVRGDHRSESNQIDLDVIKCVQDFDLCICDLSAPNVNVYYEMGRRDETGKPIVLVKPKGGEMLPVDIATRRYIEYDLDDRHRIRDAIAQLRNFVSPLVDKGFEGSSKAASLSEIADVLQRLERKIDRMSTAKTAAAGFEAAAVPAPSQNDGLTPRERFKLALAQRNIPAAEAALTELQYTMSKIDFLDYFVEQVAAMGSEKSGTMLVECADEFMDSNVTFKKKVEYLGCLVSYASKTDKLHEIKVLFDNIIERLIGESDDAPTEQVASVYNQRNRFYWGLYQLDDDVSMLEEAIKSLEKAYEVCPTAYICYNTAICLREHGDKERATEFIEECLSISGEKVDLDHLELAVRIYYETSNPKFSDAMERLKSLSPQKAYLLQMKLDKK